MSNDLKMPASGVMIIHCGISANGQFANEETSKYREKVASI